MGLRAANEHCRYRRAEITSRNNKKHRAFHYNRVITFEHKVALRHLLNKLMRKHKWKEAAGVLSLYMQGTHNHKAPFQNRRKYSAALELIRQIKGPKHDLHRLQRIYDLWSHKQRLYKYSLYKNSYLIRLEYALHFFAQGNIQEAYNISNILVLKSESRRDPLVNMIHGLILYHRWYSGIPEELHFRASDADMPLLCLEPDLSSASNEQSATVNSRNSPTVNTSNHHALANISGGGVDCVFDSDSSICMDKVPHDSSGGEFPKLEIAPILMLQNYDSAGQEEIGVTEVYSTAEDEISEGISIYDLFRLGPSLLPLQFQTSLESGEYPIVLTNDDHNEAVKHLRIALYSKPPVLAALLPLIQLLLLGNQAQEALMVLKEFCHNSDFILPNRLRVRLLECFCRENSALIRRCHEDVLQRDPTSEESVLYLIDMYTEGKYEVQQLLEMIVLHLDAAYGTSYIWGQLASCFLSLQAFAGHESRKAWRLRCRWWSNRHFSSKAYVLDEQADGMELLVSKTACALHLYGVECEYVKSVLHALEEETEKISLLKEHFDNCMELQKKLNY
ncbi:uncharacterized protein LOC18435924 isoform X2 [Amborella trichopoda]|uniref:uncharacterized protein LOC18435924 isoform X2 n=1 Tax=Amborella trichopoda TaxID=13333 RepID=UPI0005D34A8C|nr:uncharacterized protein LOC18435924 isoform X2 [Amborella trichopoda]|eukprot:XP_011624033.1 uncharacterized protein LOC18435924 isoform X2 [Amborella trichopoda]